MTEITVSIAAAFRTNIPTTSSDGHLQVLDVEYEILVNHCVFCVCALCPPLASGQIQLEEIPRVALPQIITPIKKIHVTFLTKEIRI